MPSDKEKHSYNRHKNRTKRRCYKLTATKAKRSGLKIPDPTLSQIWCYKRFVTKPADRRRIDSAEAQMEE